MNVYKLTVGTETELISARTVFQALATYKKLTDWDIDDFDEHNDDIEIFPESEWEGYDMRSEYDNSIMSVKDWMEKNTESTLICSTAY
jgi:hypothetical protein